MDKVPSTNFTFKNNKANINNSKKGMTNLSKNVTDFDNIEVKKTSSFIDNIKDIFAFVTKDDVVDMFRDNHFKSVLSSDIEDIQPFFDHLFVTMKNGYTYTFQQDGGDIKIVQISNSINDIINFGQEGIDSIYDIVGGHNPITGDKMAINDFYLNSYGISVTFNYTGATYFIDKETKKVTSFSNPHFGNTSVTELRKYIDDFANKWAESRDNIISVDDLKEMYHLSPDDITYINVSDNKIYITLNDYYYLTIVEDSKDEFSYRLSSKNGTEFYDEIYNE